MPTRSIPWLRILAEGIAIVVSILLAFGIQAWWEGREARRLREALLTGLEDDFVRAAEEVTRVRNGHLRGRNSGESLLVLGFDGPVSQQHQLQVDSLTAGVLGGATFDAPISTLQSVLATGGLTALADPELAASLAAWQAAEEDLNREQANVISKIEQLLAFLRGKGIDTSSLFGMDLPYPVRPSETYTLVHDPEFRSLVSDLQYFYRVTLRKLGTMTETLEALRTHLPNLPAQDAPAL